MGRRIKIVLRAPPGKFGVTIESSITQSKGCCIVRKVSKDSPLFGKIEVGDWISQLDDQSCRGWTLDDVVLFLSRRSKHYRVITILRKSEDDMYATPVKSESNVRAPSPDENMRRNGPSASLPFSSPIQKPKLALASQRAIHTPERALRRSPSVTRSRQDSDRASRRSSSVTRSRQGSLEAQRYCIRYEDVRKAYKRIDGSTRVTPTVTCASLDDMLHTGSFHTNYTNEEATNTSLRDPSASPALKRRLSKSHVPEKRKNLFFKVEAVQRTGSFKFRGAMNSVLALVEETQAKRKNRGILKEIHLVTHSSGNHASALALASSVASKRSVEGRKDNGGCHVRTTVVMPRGATKVKANAVRAYGAKVVLVDNCAEAQQMEAHCIAKEEGAVFIHPSEDPRVIAGQGTAALEMVKQVSELLKESKSEAVTILDAVIIPVGGGGLAAGTTVALRGVLGYGIKIILAEPEEMDDAKRSKDAGELLGHRSGTTLNSCADALKTTLGPNTWPIIRDQVDDIIPVSEIDILRATKLVWERLKICIEPSAAVAVACALGHTFAAKYKADETMVNIGVMLSGGNVDICKLGKMMENLD